MYYFVLSALFLLGLVLVISGNQTLTQEVRANLAPEDIETIHNELLSRKHVGQLILVSLCIILMFHLA